MIVVVIVRELFAITGPYSVDLFCRLYILIPSCVVSIEFILYWLSNVP